LEGIKNEMDDLSFCERGRSVLRRVRASASGKIVIELCLTLRGEKMAVGVIREIFLRLLLRLSLSSLLLLTLGGSGRKLEVRSERGKNPGRRKGDLSGIVD
jgi:hypothetical protein